MKNPARKKSVQSGDFRRKHAVVHVSAIMHILPGYRGTYIWGVCTFGALQPTANFKGYLFSEGYLFTGFYGTLAKSFTVSEIKSKSKKSFCNTYQWAPSIKNAEDSSSESRSAKSSEIMQNNRTALNLSLSQSARSEQKNMATPSRTTFARDKAS